MTAPIPFDITPEALQEEVLAHRKARVARLTADKGWLSLVNKVWLREGTQKIGSEPGSEILLAADRAPARVGVVTSERRCRALRRRPFGRSPFAGQPDRVVGDAVRCREGSHRASCSARWPSSSSCAVAISRFACATRRARCESNSRGCASIPSIRAGASSLRFEPFAREKEVVLEDGDGKPQPYLSPGAALFEKDGKPCRLEPVFDSDRKRLFVLFSDETNRVETYAAGRFLYTPLPTTAKCSSTSTSPSTPPAPSPPTPPARFPPPTIASP